MNFLAEHVELLKDKVRLDCFDRALRKCVGKGDLVLDIGTGTGIMSFLALRAGAKGVCAIERGRVLQAARRLAQAHGLADRIRWFHGEAVKTRLPRKADLLVTETLGHIGVDEGILATVPDAHRRLLNRPGRVIPRDFSVMVAAVTVPSVYREWIAWKRSVQGVSYRPLQSLAVNAVWLLPRWPRRTLSRSRPIFTFSLPGLRENPLPAEAECRMRIDRGGAFHGMMGSFRATLAPGVILDSSRTSSWRPLLFPSREPARVKAGDQLLFKLRLERDGQYTWDIRLKRGQGVFFRSVGSTLLLHPAASKL